MRMLPKYREELEGTLMLRVSEGQNGVMSDQDVLGTNGSTVGTVPTAPLTV